MSDVHFFTPVVNFFTPIKNTEAGVNEKYKNLRFCEKLFDFGQRSVRVTKIENGEANFADNSPAEKSLARFTGYAIKAALIATVLLPTVAIIGKYIYRKANHYTAKSPGFEKKVTDAAAKALGLVRKDSHIQLPTGAAPKDPMPPVSSEPSGTTGEEPPLFTTVTTGPTAPVTTEEPGSTSSSALSDVNLKHKEFRDASVYIAGYMGAIEEAIKGIPKPSKESPIDIDFLIAINQALVEISTIREVLDGEIAAFKESEEKINSKLSVEEAELARKELSTIKVDKSLLAKQEELKKQLEEVVKENNEAIAGHANVLLSNPKKPHRFVSGFFSALKKEIGLKDTQIPSSELLSTEIAKTGIANQGNSCWLNSCMQSMLSSRVIVAALDELVPGDISKLPLEEPSIEIPVMKSFKEIRKAMAASPTPEILGRIAAQLRINLFKSLGSPEKDRREYRPGQERHMHDPGTLYLMLLKNLGLMPIVTQISTPLDETGASMGDPKLDPNPILLPLPSLEVAGQEGSSKPTVQTLLTSETSEDESTKSDPWKRGGKIVHTRKTRYEIKGTPPPVLVVQMKAGYDKEDDRAVDSYKLQKDDLEIDIKKMLPDAGDISTKYRLVSFAQNQSQGHWVAFGMEKDKWRYFSDSYVKENPTIIDQVADYCIYERIE